VLRERQAGERRRRVVEKRVAKKEEITLRRRAAQCRRLAEGAVPFDVASALYGIACEFEAQAAAAATPEPTGRRHGNA
jgi:hypothetical protein